MLDISRLLATPKTLHFIGVGGSGMFPLVQILLSQGHRIQGSDVNEGSIIETERALGVRVMMGQRAENIHGADFIVFSAAIPADNPERREAQRLGIPTVERSVLLGYVASLYKKPLCIAGTHGKTTATGMATQILQMAGQDPAAVIGGKLPLIGGYGKAGSGDVIVVEACEYHNTFLQLRPHTAVLLNVDNDHLEFFGNMANLKAAFRQFCSLASGSVIYNADDENTRQTVDGLPLPLLSFGTSEACDVRASGLREYKPAFWAFDVSLRGAAQGEIRLGAPGLHNVSNALAAYAACRELGASHAQCAAGLFAFAGAGRRFEILGELGGVTIANDYAHHPAELRATLSTAKQMNFKSVWAVFQPYTFSRTHLLLSDFAAVLPIADHVVMTAIMPGRENPNDHTITTEALASRIPGSVWFQTQQEVARYVMANASAGDLVLTLGCGDIYKCAHMMLEATPNL